MLIKIKHRFNGSVLFSHDCEENSLKITLEMAIKASANLRYANLRYADLSYANLRCANLSYANLSYADLSYANLSYANLSYANLSSANLSYANLSSANLLGEKLTKSPLQFYGLVWDVLVTDGFLTIGCQRHTHEDWANFNDDQIRKMDFCARLFWKSWKEPLLMMCKNHAKGIKENETT